jgi:hypothetical protein
MRRPAAGRQSRRRPGVRRLAIAIALTALALACHSSNAATNTTIALGNSDSGRIIAAQVGATIEVTLQTIGPGQYGTPTVTGASIQFLGEFSAGPSNPGGPRQLFRFEAASVGQAYVTVPHVGESPIGSTPPFEFTVTVF